MAVLRIKALRAFVARGGGADYHDQESGHWIDGRIAALAEGFGVPVVPHGSSVYSYHFVTAWGGSPFAEFLMMAPEADRIAPMFGDLFLDEPVPAGGRLRVSDAPGFGVELNRSLGLARPHAR